MTDKIAFLTYDISNNHGETVRYNPNDREYGRLGNAEFYDAMVIPQQGIIPRTQFLSATVSNADFKFRISMEVYAYRTKHILQEISADDIAGDVMEVKAYPLIVNRIYDNVNRVLAEYERNGIGSIRNLVMVTRGFNPLLRARLQITEDEPK